VTSWLQGMFLAPVMLGFLALIPIVVLLYLLKLRRTQVLISSTMLWMKSLQDLTANAPFQRLRKNLLLLLQILILIALATALARPYLQAEGVSNRNYCLLIDASASMQTREGDATRLDLAKDKAREILENMQRGDKMMIVAFAENSDVLCELTDDTVRLRETIDAITASDTRTRVRDSVFLAHSLQMTVPKLEAVIISDGNIRDLDDVSTLIVFAQASEETGATDAQKEQEIRAVNVSFLRVGETTNNAGIVAFSVRDPLESGGDRQCFVLVHNDHSEPLATTVSLLFNNDALAVEEITVPPSGDQEVLFAYPELGTGILRAQLDHSDALDVDNQAWLALRPPERVRALLVGEGDSVATYYLKRLLSLDGRVALSEVTPDNYAATTDYDLTIFDGYAPTELPSGTLLYLNALPPIAGIEVAGELANPPVLSTDADHPVMRYLNPSNVLVSKAQRVTLPEGARTLVASRGGPLVADVSRGGQQILFTTFGVGESNWPLRLSFPLFFQNLVSWVPRAGLAEETSIDTGRPLQLAAAPDGEAAMITRPDGTTESITLDPLRPVFFGATEQAGPYVVERGEASFSYAANLLDRLESSVTPATALRVGRAEVRPEDAIIKQNKELWHWFIALALAVLALEWFIYTRRAWL
jgi:aerotolerance regulator-like protein/VWA domain-containing protein